MEVRSDDSRPVLWHLDVSPFSEKVRWAFDHKGVEYEPRIALPGSHPLVARWLTRGRSKTFPVLELDGERIGDSTAIIAALEERFPEPPLYPADAAERERALGLEDFFDEELMPYMRRLVFHELTNDRKQLEDFANGIAVRPLRRATALNAWGTATFLNLLYGTGSDDRAQTARRKVIEAFDRLDAELGDSEYLVGEAFTVADLAAAAIFYPIVQPAEGPQIITRPLPGSLEGFREQLSGRRGFRWVEEIFRRHRRPQRQPAMASRPVAAPNI